MRKSTYVTILLGGAAVLGVWALSSGTQNMATPDADAKVYGDATACSQEMNAADCTGAFEAAKKEHEAQSPKFTSAADCEAAGFAKCETTQVMNANGSSTSMFMPMMMGFMMGRMMGGMGGMGGYGYGGGFGQSQPSTANGAGVGGAARPVYADRNGYLYANGSNVGRVAPGTTSLGSQAVPMRTASRGGFGATASQFGGGGS